MNVFLKGLLTGMILMGIIFLGLKSSRTNTSNVDIEAKTILKSVESISKLMVIEGNFTETYSYQEKSKVFFDLIPQEKKAIVLLEAKVIVGYDLKKMEIVIDKKNKLLIIKRIPPEDVHIIPNLKFYDIQSSTFTSFNKDDINKVQTDAKAKIEQQIENSGLKNQAKQRLLENLYSLVNLTQAIGWKVEDETNTISGETLNINFNS